MERVKENIEKNPIAVKIPTVEELKMRRGIRELFNDVKEGHVSLEDPRLLELDKQFPPGTFKNIPDSAVDKLISDFMKSDGEKCTS